MRKLLPILLALMGLGAGVGAGIVLKPEPELVASDESCFPKNEDVLADGPITESDKFGEGETTHEYVKLNNQFIVPVVREGEVNSLVVMSLSLEVAIGSRERVYEREPRVRDAFLQVLFDHANSGGFDGPFTSSGNMNVLRNSLREVAHKILGSTATDVLIIDIVRQDV